MKYYKGERECDDYTSGWCYMEIDLEKDIVIRQVDWCSGKYTYGEWTGRALQGYICDQPPSSFDESATIDEISLPEFEKVWEEAHK